MRPLLLLAACTPEPPPPGVDTDVPLDADRPAHTDPPTDTDVTCTGAPAPGPLPCGEWDPCAPDHRRAHRAALPAGGCRLGQLAPAAFPGTCDPEAPGDTGRVPPPLPPHTGWVGVDTDGP